MPPLALPLPFIREMSEETQNFVPTRLKRGKRLPCIGEARPFVLPLLLKAATRGKTEKPDIIHLLL